MRAHLVIALVGVCCLLGTSRVLAADHPWTIIIGAREVVVSTRGGDGVTPAIDSRPLAALIGISVENRGGQVIIRDSRGGEWTAAEGATILTGRSGNRLLSVPISISGGIVYLPLDVIADLAGLAVVIGPGERARLMSSLVQDTQAPAPTGWKSFQIPKSTAEREDARRMNADSAGQDAQRAVSAERLPPRHEGLIVELGVGAVTGASGATDASVSGTIAGWQLNGATFMTFGQQGALLRTGHVSATSPSATWIMDAGHILSDVRGLARGGRIGRRMSTFWSPSVTVYAPERGSRQAQAAVAYRDEVTFGSHLALRAEFGSDRSHFAAARMTAWRVGLDTFLRRAADGVTRDCGALLSYDVWRGTTVRVGARREDGPRPATWSQVGLSVPVAGRSIVAVERTRSDAATGSSSNTALSIQTPLGPFHLLQRMQVTDSALIDVTRPIMQRQLQSTASWSPSRRLRFNYQLATQWLPDAVVRQWTELQAVLRLSASTSVSTVSQFPNMTDTTHFRVSLQTMIRKRFALTIDYGRLTPFQSGTTVEDRPRVLVMVRRRVGIATPARGREVSGRVLDSAGAPIASVGVTLNEYSTLTDEQGRYRFPQVPPGEYRIALDRERLPAGLTAAEPPLLIHVGDSANVTTDLRVLALGSISGHAYVDGNHNGRYDSGEGVANVVMRLANTDRATLTGADGSYGFYNLLPGTHLVAIDTARLGSTLLAPHPLRDVEVLPNEGRSDVDLTLVVREKPVFMQELPAR